MQRVILFKGPEGTLSVIHYHPDLLGGMSVEDLAKKDVPAGYPYRIMYECELPRSRQFREAWEADEFLQKPDGYGIGADAWFKIQSRVVRG